MGPGPGPSPSLEAFSGPFRPFAETGPRGDKRRRTGFAAADPSGNGLCTLPELEHFALAVVRGSVRPARAARRLFARFRPCLARAFADAKDYKADDGAVLEGRAAAGTAATADDFVSRGEFRLFNAMTLIYAAMYDAFSKVDGATEGPVEADETGSDEEDEEDDQRARGAEKDAEKEKDGCGGGGGASESTAATSGGKLGDKESAEEAATDAAAGASPNGNVAADEDNGDGEDRRIDR